ncbi:hypothetical protein PT113_09300, partial [Erysipelothrix rhusiopathiae]|nr:hypothetical protein [Erysipelothrix rhusiopathiae]
ETITISPIPSTCVVVSGAALSHENSALSNAPTWVITSISKPRYEENNNFFPEYYVIPMEPSMQKNLHAATEMMEYLLRNDVKV